MVGLAIVSDLVIGYRLVGMFVLPLSLYLCYQNRMRRLCIAFLTLNASYDDVYGREGTCKSV